MSAYMFDQESSDQLIRERGKCMNRDCTVRKYTLLLRACEQRLERKPYTKETCHQEFVDLMEAIDVCVGINAFLRFK